MSLFDIEYQPDEEPDIPLPDDPSCGICGFDICACDELLDNWRDRWAGG